MVQITVLILLCGLLILAVYKLQKNKPLRDKQAELEEVELEGGVVDLDQEIAIEKSRQHDVQKETQSISEAAEIDEIQPSYEIPKNTDSSEEVSFDADAE